MGWCDVEKGKFQPACFLPFLTSDNSDNQVQLIQRYEIHVGWMNTNTQMFLPLARLLYSQTAFGRTSSNAYCCSVQVKRPRGLIEEQGDGVRSWKRESRWPSFDPRAVPVNPLPDVAERPVKLRECIVCSHRLADGHVLCHHLLTCHHLDSMQPKQMG